MGLGAGARAGVDCLACGRGSSTRSTPRVRGGEFSSFYESGLSEFMAADGSCAWCPRLSPAHSHSQATWDLLAATAWWPLRPCRAASSSSTRRAWSFERLIAPAELSHPSGCASASLRFLFHLCSPSPFVPSGHRCHHPLQRWWGEVQEWRRGLGGARGHPRRRALVWAPLPLLPRVPDARGDRGDYFFIARAGTQGAWRPQSDLLLAGKTSPYCRRLTRPTPTSLTPVPLVLLLTRS